MSRKEVFRVGDRIKIVNPEIVVRVGYPLAFKDARKIVQELYGKKVDLFLADIGFRQMFETNFGIMKMEADGTGTTEDKILNALAYEYLRKEKFGGNERKIYRTLEEHLAGCETIVLHKRVVKTGFYFPPSCGYIGYYEPEWEYEPGGLSKEQTHVLLTIGFGVNDCEIETCNVVKL